VNPTWENPLFSTGLIDEDKALVTDIPGTTRDMVEEYINIKGIPFHIMDTAGIRQTDNVVEKMGVDKAMDLVDKADLILFITDVSRETSEDEKRLEQRMAGKTVIRIRNKIDLAKDDGGNEGGDVALAVVRKEPCPFPSRRMWASASWNRPWPTR